MNTKKIIAILLMAVMAFTLCSCMGGGNEEPDETKDAVTTAPQDTEADKTADVTFTVKVVDGEGNALSGVNVQVCDDANCFISPSDADGIATFKSAQIEEITSSHKICIPFLPAGYECEYTSENPLYLEDGITEFTIVLTKVG